MECVGKDQPIADQNDSDGVLESSQGSAQVISKVYHCNMSVQCLSVVLLRHWDLHSNRSRRTQGIRNWEKTSKVSAIMKAKSLKCILTSYLI